MNQLFIYAGGLDVSSNHAKLQEFWKLDKEIERMYDTMSYKELFHSLEFAVMNCRAKSLIENLI